MRIVFLSYLHGFGGAEKQIIMLANAMAKRNHDVTLISISVDNVCYPLDDQVKYISLPDRKSDLRRIVTRYLDIRKTLKNIKPDLTVSFWFQSAYLTALMKKSITGKVVYSERGDPGDEEYDGFLGLVRKLTLPRIDGFVFQSKGAQLYFDDDVQSKSIIIPNPVFVKAIDYPEVKNRRKVIVTVGRLHPQKNHKLLINAFSQIEKQIPNYVLEIYGDGILKDELQKQIDNLGLTNRVFLKGTSSEIHKMIYDASLFVLSSDYEGLPNTLLEAMSLGIPCISTDCKPGGAREIINDKENGLIVPINDDRALSYAMLQLLTNPSILRQYSIAGIDSSKKYLPDRIYQMWDLFLTGLI